VDPEVWLPVGLFLPQPAVMITPQIVAADKAIAMVLFIFKSFPNVVAAKLPRNRSFSFALFFYVWKEMLFAENTGYI
jgi:hypothetical protein